MQQTTDRLLDSGGYGIAHTGAQAPLVLRYQTHAFWPALQRRIECTEAVARVIIALWSEWITTGRWTSYSRNREHYGAFDSTYYTKHLVVSAVDWLDRKGLIQHFRQQEGVRGWQSAMRALPELISIVEAVMVEVGKPIPIRPSDQVILRDAAGMPISYAKTRATERMSSQVDKINDALLKADVSSGTACMHRVFNESFGRGGRWYCIGGSWQSMSGNDRLMITIDGVDVVELDYKTMHPTMVYSDAGLAIPEDAYDIPGFDRDLVKLGFLVMVNARSATTAAGAIAELDEIASLAVPSTKDALKAAWAVMGEIKARHATIEHVFQSDAGAGLMKRDSGIATDVIMQMHREGHVVLPVHDSFIVKATAHDLLLDVMKGAADRAGLSGLRIERKLPKADVGGRANPVKHGGLSANLTTSGYCCGGVVAGRGVLCLPVSSSNVLSHPPVESQLAHPSEAPSSPVESLPVVPVSSRPHPLSRLPRIHTSSIDLPWDNETVDEVSTSSNASWSLCDWMDNPALELSDVYHEPNTLQDGPGDAETSKSGPKSSAPENDRKSDLADVSDDDAREVEVGVVGPVMHDTPEAFEAMWKALKAAGKTKVKLKAIPTGSKPRHRTSKIKPVPGGTLSEFGIPRMPDGRMIMTHFPDIPF